MTFRNNNIVPNETARQGKEGSCRVICTKRQYTNSISKLELDPILNEFDIKKKLQQEFYHRSRIIFRKKKN